MSDWLLTPAVTLRNGDTLKFWTSTYQAPAYPDRLQVRMSTAGASTNTGTTATDLGDFTTLLLDINPTYLVTGYPSSSTQMSIGPLSGLPAGGVSGRLAFRYFVENGGPSGLNSDVINIDDVDYTSSAEPTGACCFTNGSCSVLTSGACASQGGTFAGTGVTCVAANCPQPPTGACCTDAGTCSMLTTFACAASGGVWSGANVTCAAANCQPGWVEVGEAGETIGTAQAVTGPANAHVPFISGSVAASGDADLYKVTICDEANFLATTVNAQTTSDTQLFLFDSTGHGIVMDDDDVGVSGSLQSRITTQFVTANGTYYLGVSFYNTDPQDSAAGLIWNNQNSTPAYGPEWTPNGPAAANALAQWDHGASTPGTYRINLTGVCTAGGAAGCYANCDHSTSNPLLTANDFQCFLNEYASATSYANCDGSTSVPLLTANDFQCFLNAYAGGCS